jgi:hypothetical protein
LLIKGHSGFLKNTVVTLVHPPDHNSPIIRTIVERLGCIKICPEIPFKNLFIGGKSFAIKSANFIIKAGIVQEPLFVIFIAINWEFNKKELRIHRPDGTADKLESGSFLGVNVAPLEPNRWYSLKWQIHAKGMAVYCDGRLIWSEKKPYDVENMKANISVHSVRSVVDVKEMKVRQLFVID